MQFKIAKFGPRSKVALALGFLGLILAPTARALETEVSTGVLYYPSDAEKLMRAQTERGEDGLEFAAPRDPRAVAHDNAEEELRNGNICLRQLRGGLRESVRSWRVRDLCNAVFHDSLGGAETAAVREHFHPDHLECRAEAEARESGGSIQIVLAFRARLVMKDRTPPKLRHAGLGGEVVSRELPEASDLLGTVSGSWKEALKAGACTADSGALEKFWGKLQRRARDQRELALCQQGHDRDVAGITKLQKQLADYVPEEWVKEGAGENYEALLGPAPALAADAGITACRQARDATDHQLEKLRSLSSKIAGKYDVPALDLERTGNRSPASTGGDEEE